MPSSRPKLMTYTTNEVIEKFKIVSEADNRSMSKELEYIVKEYINAYEQKHGTIKNLNIIDNKGTINM